MAEVTEGSSASITGQEHVVSFDIAMQNPVCMEVFQPLQGLAQVVKGSVFWQTALLLYELA